MFQNVTIPQLIPVSTCDNSAINLLQQFHLVFFTDLCNFIFSEKPQTITEERIIRENEYLGLMSSNSSQLAE